MSNPGAPPATSGSARLWLAVVPAMLEPLLSSFFYFVILETPAWAQATYAASKVFLVVWPLFAVAVILREPLPRPGLRNPAHLKAVPPGLLLGLLICVIMFALMATPLHDVLRESVGKMKVKTVRLGILEHYWLFAVFLSFVHSLLEEYYWRWFVYGGLRRRLAVAPAVVLAGVAFGSHHVVIVTQLVGGPWGVLFGSLVGAGGMIWSLMYEKQRTLAGAWTCHMLVDLGVMTLGYYLLAGH